MRRRVRPARGGSQRGSTLIEVLVAVVLFSVGIIALFRTLAASMVNSADLQYRSIASTVAEQKLGQMWVDPANLATSATSGVAVPQLPSGKEVVVVNGKLVQVTVTWQAPNSQIAGNYVVYATLVSN